MDNDYYCLLMISRTISRMISLMEDDHYISLHIHCLLAAASAIGRLGLTKLSPSKLGRAPWMELQMSNPPLSKAPARRARGIAPKVSGSKEPARESGRHIEREQA